MLMRKLTESIAKKTYIVHTLYSTVINFRQADDFSLTIINYNKQNAKWKIQTEI